VTLRTRARAVRKNGRSLCVVAAPSNLGLKPPTNGNSPGVRGAPAVLLELGLVDRLHAAYAGEVASPPYLAAIEPSTGVRNADGICAYTVDLADKISDLLERSKFPLVLGGDCSILLGSALALKRRGRYGLLFIDGHADLLTPETSETGGVAGMDLAIATGTGPSRLISIESLGPYFLPEDVVVCGFRQPEPETMSPGLPAAPMRSLPLALMRKRGWSRAVKEAVAHFGERPFWIHVDADVLDPLWMSAVDSPDPGGMNPAELSILLGFALEAKNCVGMELTIYDPTLDPSREGAALLVNLLVDALAKAE
jgi:arginase